MLVRRREHVAPARRTGREWDLGLPVPCGGSTYTEESQVTNPYTTPDEPGFNPAYRGTPPWDIGRPQPDFVRLEEAGRVQGAVFDVGHGAGVHRVDVASAARDHCGVRRRPVAVRVDRRQSADRDIQG